MTRIPRDRITYLFSRDLQPVATADPGDILVFETLDAASGRLKTLQDALTVYAPMEKANPAPSRSAARNRATTWWSRSWTSAWGRRATPASGRGAASSRTN
jgi:hypothetical protein